MNDFTTLETALHRAVALAAGVCLALLTVTVASLVYAYGNARLAWEAGVRMPVLVVPGAVGGVYSPGLTEESVRATARYLSTLATNFGNGRSFADHFDELEAFSSARYLPQLQQARRALQRDVETQNQARSFYPESSSERFAQSDPGHFNYVVSGERMVYASGLPMDSRRSEVRLRLQWGVPSSRNRAGIVLEGFDVADAPAPLASKTSTLADAQHP